MSTGDRKRRVQTLGEKSFPNENWSFNWTLSEIALPDGKTLPPLSHSYI